MKNITAQFEEVYLPQKALVLYQSPANASKIYLEAYDMDDAGKPVNAHPLSVRECNSLARCLMASDIGNHRFLQPKGLLPEKVLQVVADIGGYALWYTPSQKVPLYFREELTIPSGEAFVPALLWSATREKLCLYALKEDSRPELSTTLYHAPFFNVYGSGQVCMGTVDMDIAADCGLEEFMQQWEQAFWNSYFSHLIADVAPVKGNIVQLWQQQVTGGTPFPVDRLVKNGRTIKNLLR